MYLPRYIDACFSNISLTLGIDVDIDIVIVFLVQYIPVKKGLCLPEGIPQGKLIHGIILEIPDKTAVQQPGQGNCRELGKGPPLGVGHGLMGLAPGSSR